MEIFKIWSTFDLKGNALQQMEKFSVLTKRSSDNLNFLNERLKVTSLRLMSFHSHLSKINPDLAKLSNTFVKLHANTKDSKDTFNLYNRSITEASENTRSLVRNTEVLAAKLDAVAIKGRLAAESLGGMPVGRGGKGRGRGSLSHGFLHGTGLGFGLGSFGAGTMAAYGAGATLVHGFNVAADYQVMLGQLKALGYSPDQVSEVNKFVESQNIRGVSKLQVLRAFLDAQMATRESAAEAVGPRSEVKQFAPILAKTRFAANVTYGGISDIEEQNLIRFAEIMGGSSMDRRKAFLDAAMQMMVSSGGSIRPTELRTFARQAGGAFANLSPTALVGLEPLFQELGGAKMATGLVTGLRQLITGTGSNFNKKQVNFLESIGLLKATYDKEGRPLGVEMPNKFAAIAGNDPFAFLTEVILPLMKKSGIDINDPNAMSRALTLGFGRTYANELQIMLKSRQTIERQREQLTGIGGVQGQYENALMLNKAAPELVVAAWADFSKAIGDLTSPSITFGLKAIAEALEGLANFLSFFGKSKEERLAIVKSTENNVNELYKSPFLSGYNRMFSSADAFSPTGTGIPDLFGLGKPTGAISSAAKPSQSGMTTVNLNVDGKKLASTMFPNMTNMISGAGVVAGSAYGNVSLTPYSTNYNNIGSP